MSDPAEDAPLTFPVTVDEFCSDLSRSDKRPELIYAFSKDEISNGRHRDMAENYSARFADFANRIPA